MLFFSLKHFGPARSPYTPRYFREGLVLQMVFTRVHGLVSCYLVSHLSLSSIDKSDLWNGCGCSFGFEIKIICIVCIFYHHLAISPEKVLVETGDGLFLKLGDRMGLSDIWTVFLSQIYMVLFPATVGPGRNAVHSVYQGFSLVRWPHLTMQTL